MKPEVWIRFFGVAATVLVLGAIAWWMASNSSPKINTVYGKRRGPNAISLNGTSVFGRMFQERGARVRNAYRLSPGLKRTDVIVWTPDSFELPRQEEIDFFEEEWLSTDDGRQRTLIYVVRDFESAVDYWQLQAEHSEGTPYIESVRQRARIQGDHAYMKSLTGTKAECDWFSVETLQHTLSVQPTQGPWKSFIESEEYVWRVSGVLSPKEFGSRDFRTSRVMLGAEETALVLEITDRYAWPDGRVLVLVNGGATLNYPLVQHENRRLAGQIIDFCPGGERVTFLESGPEGVRVSRAKKNSYSGFEALTVWPMNVILLHLIAAGIMFCVMVFPIFGRARQVESDSPSSFGKHVQAIQRLLEIAKDRELAIAQVNQYRQLEGDQLLKPQEKSEPGNPFKVSQA